MVATNRWLWNDETGELTTSTRWRHFPHDRLVDLVARRPPFHGSAPAAFFRRDRLREHGLRYDVRIRPAFEDGHFCSSTCSTTSGRMVGFLSPPATTTASAGRQPPRSAREAHPGRYDRCFTYGYLALLTPAAGAPGTCPLAQASLLRDRRVLRAARAGSGRGRPRTARRPTASTSRAGGAGPPRAERRLCHIPDPHATLRLVIEHGYGDEPWHDPSCSSPTSTTASSWSGRVPLHRPRSRARRSPTAAPAAPARQDPRLQLLRPGADPADPLAAVTARPAIRLDGVDMPVVFRQPAGPGHHGHTGRMRWQLGRAAGARVRHESKYVPHPEPAPRTAAGPAAVAAAAQGAPLPPRLGADGPHPRRRRQRRDPVQAPPRAPPRDQRVVRGPGGHLDWKRLRKEGYGDRLVAHGSHAVAAADGQLRCTCISSHADEAVVAPAGDRGVHRAAVAVHLPPARRHQGRPVRAG